MDGRLTKNEIVEALNRENDRLLKTILRLTLDQMTQPGTIGDWSVKDVLAHLIFWNHFVVDELQAALAGKTLEFDHSDTDAVNERAVARYRDHSFMEVSSRYSESFREVMRTVWSLPDRAFEPGSSVERALGDTIAGALHNNTYDHYALHCAQIETWLEQLGVTNG
jgi:uncharacterized protein (TIGR03083 family)